MLQIHRIPAIETFQVDNVYIGEAYCCYEGYESQSVILMILSDCPTDTYIGHSSFCIVFLMEPRPLFIRVRDGSVCYKVAPVIVDHLLNSGLIFQ